MTNETNAREASFSAADAAELHHRWSDYMDQARAELGADAEPERLVTHAAAQWRAEQPPELSFVPEEMRAILIEGRHETAEDDFLGRVDRGEISALRRRSDGAVVYLRPERLAALSAEERAGYDAYDPMLARAIRHRALETLEPEE
jgi:hypothetical protein